VPLPSYNVAGAVKVTSDGLHRARRCHHAAFGHLEPLTTPRGFRGRPLRSGWTPTTTGSPEDTAHFLKRR
jgi:hypothetical protein